MSKNILIIEDDEDIQASLRLALELEGYQVFSASNGEYALDLLPSIPDPSLILLDLMMPIMDGFEFLATRKLDPELNKIPVLVISAFPEKTMSLDAQGFVTKPVDLNELFELIKAHCL